MSFMAIGAKLVKMYTDHSFIKVAFIRSIIMAVGAYCHGKFLSGIQPCDLSKEMIAILNKRSFWGTCAYFFQLWSISLMPISIAMVLYYSSPVFAGLLNFFFNGERISVYDIFGIIFSLIGVIIILNPEVALRLVGQTID